MLTSEVMNVPAELLTNTRRVDSQPPVPTAERAGEQEARKQVQRMRRVKFHAAAYVLGMVVLTPLWAVVEWQDHGGFERWSSEGNAGDWEPWIVYVALIWGLVVAILALKAHFDRPVTDAEVERAVGHPRRHR